MFHTRCLWPLPYMALVFVASAGCPAAAGGDTGARCADARALPLQPENSYWGYASRSRRP